MKAKRVLMLVVLAIISVSGIGLARADCPPPEDRDVTYKVFAVNDEGHRQHVGRLRVTRRNQITLRKLGEYRTPRYRVQIVHPNKAVEQTPFTPARDFHFVRE